MPTQLHETFDLPFSSERAVSLMTDPEFLAELMVASGSLRPVITVTHDASSTTVSIQREFEGQWPSLVAPLIGETVASLVLGREPACDISAFDPKRFTR